MKNRGISLIVLVITIIVIVILAGAVILSISQNNPISSANEAVFKQNVDSIKSALIMEVTSNQLSNGNLNDIKMDDLKINSSVDTSIFDIIGGELVLNYKADNSQIKFAKDINLKVSSFIPSTTGESINAPVLCEGMIPVKHNGSVWVKADEKNTDNDWFNYKSDVKQWANIVTVKSDKRNDYLSSKIGTEIAISDITTFFVWIPRYAYSIKEGHYKTSDTDIETNSLSKMDVTFLKGNSNVGSDNITYPLEYNSDSISKGQKTPMIVHPGFNLGGEQLPGLWVAKFEASGNTNTPNNFASYPGNMPSDATTLVPITKDTYVTVLPSIPSWRSIRIGDCIYESMKMNQKDNVYGFKNVDTHLMKNSEWGAVAYLSASEYGKIPLINNECKYAATSSHYFDVLTGYQGGNKYDTEIGKKASTTHNIYGIYDMSGGAYEYVAACLNNGNGNLPLANSSIDTKVKYYENGSIKPEYAKYFNIYETSEEEKNAARVANISVKDLGDGKTKVTQVELCATSKTINGNIKSTVEWNETRERLTSTTFNNMKNSKGDAIFETAGSNSFYGLYNYKTSGDDAFTYGWFTNVADASALKGSSTQRYGTSYNSDFVLLGHCGLPFFLRGGYTVNGSRAGLFDSNAHGGNGFTLFGFRPVCFTL